VVHQRTASPDLERGYDGTGSEVQEGRLQTVRRKDLAVVGKAPPDISALKPYCGKTHRTVAAMLVGVLAGESPASGTCPVTAVVISGGGAGDQTVESPEVKVPVGWVRT